MLSVIRHAASFTRLGIREGRADGTRSAQAEMVATTLRDGLYTV
jgi:hypothetical protein